MTGGEKAESEQSTGSLSLDLLWVEGEHIPPSKIEEVFRSPPDVPSQPSRSALLVGSRGAGKTTFLRHLVAVHPGVAIEMSLAADLASISQEYPVGFLSVEVDTDEERAIVGKSVALAATRIAERAVNTGIGVESEQVLAAIPTGVLKSRPRRQLDQRTARRLRTAVESADLDSFRSPPKGRVLQEFATELGHSCLTEGRGPLLLVCDRGDNVVAASLAAVFELLDQSDAYSAIAATRPGPSPPPALIDTPGSAAAGDHYDVLTLGSRPASTEWRSFMRESLQTQPQLEDLLERIDEEVLESILGLARDSVRSAISVLGRARNAPRGQSEVDAVIDGLSNVAENLQLSAKKLLRQFHADPTALLRDLRKDLFNEGGTPGTPFLISATSPRQSSLLQTTTDIDRLIAVGLRCGVFCLPEGTAWCPGDRPLSVEVNPLAVWRREDGLPVPSVKSISVSKKSQALLGRHPHRPPKTSIFCAYRMQRDASIKFLEDLSRNVRRHPALSAAGISVTNGRTDPGQPWASTIRNRISKAKAVVADVTDMRPDVIFEAGFAYGHSKPIIPAVETRQAANRIPRWLTDRQTAVFGEKSGMAGILSGLITILNDPRAARRGPPKPAPGMIVWLRTLSWNLTGLEQTRGIATHEGIELEIYNWPGDPSVAAEQPDDAKSLPVEAVIEKAARAHLLVVSLDGTNGDDLMHYVAGAVAAKPKTSSDGAARRVLAVSMPGLALGEVVADSLARVTEVVRPIAEGDVRAEVGRFAESYRKWSEAG